VADDEARRKRGRPPKFGRPSQVVALTIPNDVLQWLSTIHSDPGWAIVSLAERFRSGKARPKVAKMPEVELAWLTVRQALILVNPSTFQHLKGVTVLPLARGRAFLALENGQGLADIEIAVLDRLEEPISASERRTLSQVRTQIKEWRRTPSLRFGSKSIVLVERRRTQATRYGPSGASHL
jgi:hypothetical protein